jgi:DNA-binding transcriptional LysR family regulator
MEIRQATHLIALADHASYARAAESLGITQSALTQSIARFEAELDVRLFDRGRFGATPTEAGLMLLDRARAIVAEERLARAELEAFKSATYGDLRIGVGKSVVQHLMPEALSAFARKRPRIVVTAFEGWSTELYARLLRGELDFVVSAAVPSITIDPELVQELLFIQHEQVVIGQSHPLARKPAPKLADLVDQHWVVPPAGTRRVRLLQGIFQGAGLEAPTRFTRTDSVTMLFEMIRLGAAVGWATIELMTDALREGLVVLDVPELAADRQATITMRRRSRPSPLALSLMQEVRQVAAHGYSRYGRAS